jgi:hypothetical protein
MTKFYKHAILGPDGDPGLSKALLTKRLDESGLPYLDLENGYVNVIVDVDEKRIPEMNRILQRVYDKTGVAWNIPYDVEIHDEVGLEHTLRWSSHPWGMRVEGDDDTIELAKGMINAQVRTFPRTDDYYVVDLPTSAIDALRELAGVGTQAPEDWDTIWDTVNDDPMNWPHSAFAMLVDPPADKTAAVKAMASHERFMELLTAAGIPVVEIAPGYIEFKVKGDERKDQLVLLGVMAQVERETAVAWRNPVDPVWMEYEGRDHEFAVTLHEAFTRVETEEAWDYAKTLPHAEVHSWPNGQVRAVDFWIHEPNAEDVKATMNALAKWAGPKA